MVVLVVVWLEPSGAVVVVVEVAGGGGTAGVLVVVVVVVLPSEFTVVLVESANAADAKTIPAIARNPARIGAIVVRLMRFSFSKGRGIASDRHGVVGHDAARMINGSGRCGFRLSRLRTRHSRRVTCRCHREGGSIAGGPRHSAVADVNECITERLHQ